VARTLDDFICQAAFKNGRFNAMKTTIDATGRLVIPKGIRQEAGLKPGMVLNVRWREGRIEIEPQPLPVTLRRQGRLLVAVPSQPVSPLRAEAVEQTREALRQERAPGE
jgi:AbrB family looped-hinge helix DNA binding protein